MLPDDRFTPMRLPGRIPLPLIALVRRVTILPVPTPASALELARNMLIGNLWLHLFSVIPTVVRLTVPVTGPPRQFRLVPVVVYVVPTSFIVWTNLCGTARFETGKPRIVCRARVLKSVLVGIPSLFTSLCLTWNLSTAARLAAGGGSWKAQASDLRELLT